MVTLADGLVFDEASHVFTYGDRRLVSITQTLHAVGTMVVDPRVPALVLERARDRGAKTHLAIRFRNEGRLDATSLAAEIEPYLFAWESWCARYAGDFEPLLVEEPLG